jgi:hypothetical protein|tara:strand:- start:765 stop:1709 length:945 start_codon:yes stop_codon:yes gene_type:complete
MASSFSDLGLELMVTGENAGTWGDKTNTNLELVQQAIAGYQSVTVSGTGTTTLNMTDGTISNARNAVIKLAGTITGNIDVTIPNSIEKTYIVENATSGAHTVTFKTVSGSGFTFGATEKTRAILYSDGTNIVEVINNTQNLQDLSDLANTDGNFIIGNGSNFIVESGSTARDSLSLGTSNDVQFDSFGVGTAASGTTGEIRATNDVTAFYSSDVALKENIVNIPDPLESLKKLNGVLFDWKKNYLDQRGGEDGYFVRKKDVGVIAQEVEKVLPEAVAQRKDGIKAVKYDRLTCLLIEAVKNLSEKVETLTKEKK